MIKAKANWRQIQQLWPVAVAVLAACGGASEPVDEAAKTEAGMVAATPEMEIAQARSRNSWVNCATEGGNCAVPSQRVVRYGANGIYFYKSVVSSIACNNGTWGDPVVGVVKKCNYAASTTRTAPVPAPAPAPTPAPAPAPAGAAVLSWTAPSGNVVGYRIYYGTGSRTYDQSYGTGAFVSNTGYSVSGLASGRTYYFSVTSLDASWVESAYSVEATKLVP